MTIPDTLRQRLANQQLSQSTISDPAELVRWFGAVQSQDYPGAKWALAQRIPGSTDAKIEQAFTEGKILRTHVMRPTWHFVHPSDIRWLLQLTAPRVSMTMAFYNRKVELTQEVFQRTQQVITSLLEEQTIATRQEIKAALTDMGIHTDVQRLAHIVMQAELDQVVISGPRKGKNFTYALFEERVPETKPLSRDEALAELTKRYFTSHGPSQIQDFVWWSGLTTVDTKKGLEMNRIALVSEEIDGKTYYFSPDHPKTPNIPNAVSLLSNYDEYTIGYKDRSAFHDPNSGISIYSMGALTYPHVILYEGKVIGTWRRTPKKETLLIEPKFAKKPSAEIMRKLQETAEKYSGFLSEEVVIK